MPVNHEYEHSVRHIGPQGWLPYAAVGLVAVIALIAVGSYLRSERLEAASGKPASIAAIMAKPADYIGRTVTVNGRVVRVLSPNYYSMSDSGGELLIYSPRGIPDVPSRVNHPMLAAGDVVKALGTVKRYEPPAGSLAYNPNFTPFKGGPILKAESDSIVTAAVLPPNFRSPQPPPRTYPVVSDFKAIAAAKDRGAMVGSRVEVRNVTVERVISDRGFWVRLPDGQRLFCRLQRGLDEGEMEWMVQVKENQIASLNGVLADPPSAEAMDRKWDLETAEAQEVAAFSVYLKVDGIVLRRPVR